MTKDTMLQELLNLETNLKEITKGLRQIDGKWRDHFDTTDPEDMYLCSTFAKVEDELSTVRRLIQGIEANVIAEGRLKMKGDGQYVVENTDAVLTAGAVVEVLFRSSDKDAEWIVSGVELCGEAYTLSGFPRLDLEGLTVRIKQYPSE
ncbi:DUF5348 domain-containing protein [Paenibacillus sp. XY044]|uniref:DUF5348 domain-containing protein n=1 Tax=Paenibacillus sp. XY044 TaxID=2026089 RepID=UPI000B98FE02|nr:DUF5348 domain-containing protein [Paenibacillus sp. XY044]OZB98699.1 hypothetical protein CJP46_06060 [Paenibacillus sp. XY044]